MRFENSSGNWLSDRLNSVRFSVRFGMYAGHEDLFRCVTSKDTLDNMLR